ncbi:MAG TPA: HipA family kinase, partial [Kofleriaceae bacterium]|nr:HipA family kinase [Kofleriaceae bacterium]
MTSTIGAGLPRVLAARFVVALREGGSLPGVIEGDDGRLWVGKFRGAGQGAAALVAEVIGGELARALGLPMPAQVVLGVPPRFGITDGDPEVNELLARSPGDNLGVEFLPSAIGYDPAARAAVDAELAARVIAFDVLMGNVDRTFRNPNLLWSGGRLWLIDHGAALYWQHGWEGGTAGATAPLPRLAEHVLWPVAGDVAAAAAWLAEAAGDDALAAALALVPDAWLEVDDPPARRAAFVARLALRRAALGSLVVDPRGPR